MFICERYLCCNEVRVKLLKKLSAEQVCQCETTLTQGVVAGAYKSHDLNASMQVIMFQFSSFQILTSVFSKKFNIRGLDQINPNYSNVFNNLQIFFEK